MAKAHRAQLLANVDDVVGGSPIVRRSMGEHALKPHLKCQMATGPGRGGCPPTGLPTKNSFCPILK